MLSSRWLIVFLLMIVAPVTRSVSGQRAAELSPDRPIERAFGFGEEHEFRAVLVPDHVMRIHVDKQGADLELVLGDAGQGDHCVWHSPTGAQGPESVLLLGEADVASQVVVTVRSLATRKQSGKYRLTVGPERPRRAGDEVVGASQRSLCRANEWLSGENESLRADAVLAELDRAGVEVAEFDAALASSILLVAGRLLGKQERYEDAVERLSLAEAGFEERGLRAGQMTASYELGRRLADLGEYERALGLQRLSSRLAEQSGDRLAWARATTSEGSALADMGQIEEAIGLYAKALAVFEELGDDEGSAGPLINTGVALDESGRPHEALAYYERAIDALGEGRTLEYATILNNLANLSDRIGEKQEALSYFSQSLSILEELENRGGVATVRMNLARTLSSLGDLEGALAIYDESLVELRELGLRRFETWAVSNRGHVLKDLGRLPEARESLEEARRLRKELQDRRGEAYTVTSLAEVYRAEGELDVAIRLLGEALQLWRSVKDSRGEVSALLTLAEVEIDLGQSSKARAHIEVASELATRAADPLNEARCLAVRATLERAEGDYASAVESLAEVVDSVESVRLRVAGEQNRARFLATKQKYYDRLVELHLKQADDSEGGRSRRSHEAAAFSVSDRGRARSSIDRLFGDSPDIENRIDSALLARRRELVGQLSRTDRERRSAFAEEDLEEVEALDRKIRSLMAQIRGVSGEIRAADPAYGELTEPPGVAVDDVQRSLASDELFLEFALLEDGAYLFLIGPERFRTVSLGSSRRLREQASEFARLLSGTYGRRSHARYPDMARRLGELLLGEVVAELAGVKRLYVVPEASLHYVPFAALQLGRVDGSSEPLVVHHETVMMPSASVFVATRTNERVGKATRRVAAFGDPVFRTDDPRVRNLAQGVGGVYELERDGRLVRAIKDLPLDVLPRLSWTRREVEVVASLVPPDQRRVRLDFSASLASVLEPELGDFEFVHFATHGVFNDVHPDLSGIVLSQLDSSGQPVEGFLTAPQIFGLRLNAALVVLSGCQTALGSSVEGEGVLGLVRALHFAGARSVIASLWNVEDEATAGLVERLYRGLLEDGLRPSEALRQAQLALLREPATASPYYWAAFIQQGG